MEASERKCCRCGHRLSESGGGWINGNNFTCDYCTIGAALETINLRISDPRWHAAIDAAATLLIEGPRARVVIDPPAEPPRL